MGGRRLGDVLAERSVLTALGRDAELATLGEALRRDAADYLVWHVHGLPGIGKSSLLHAFASRARAAGATVLALDCRAIEPTEAGMLRALGGVLGAPVA